MRPIAKCWAEGKIAPTCPRSCNLCSSSTLSAKNSLKSTNALLLTLSTTLAGIGERAGEIMSGLQFFSTAEPASEPSRRGVNKRVDNDGNGVAVGPPAWDRPARKVSGTPTDVAANGRTAEAYWARHQRYGGDRCWRWWKSSIWGHSAPASEQ